MNITAGDEIYFPRDIPYTFQKKVREIFSAYGMKIPITENA